MASAMSHAPKGKDGKFRVVFYAFPHIGVSPSGEIGHLRRLGMNEDSKLCGALLSLRTEMSTKNINFGIDALDIEYSHLKLRLLSKIEYGQIPTPSEITEIAYRVILEDLETLIKNVSKNISNFDYAVFTGVQIHSPSLLTFIWPGECYAMVNNEKFVIDLKDQHHEHHNAVLP